MNKVRIQQIEIIFYKNERSFGAEKYSNWKKILTRGLNSRFKKAEKIIRKLEDEKISINESEEH